MRKATRLNLLYLLLMLALLVSSPAQGAMGDIQQFVFKGFGPEDVVGPGESPGADGNPDGIFSTTITAIGAVVDFAISAEDGTVLWDTKAGNSIPGIHVRDSGGKVLTDSGGNMPITPLLLGASFTLHVHDDGAIAMGGKFTLTATFVDGSKSTATVEIARTAPEEPPTSSEVQIVSARWIGENLRDLTGKSEKLAGDGVSDKGISVLTQGGGQLTGVVVRGGGNEWDTIPDNGIWLVAVSSDGKVINRKNGTVKWNIKGKTTFDLWFTDKGGKTKRGSQGYEVALVFADGSVASERVGQKSSPVESAERFEGDVRLIGPGNRDLVGRDERRAGNGKPDLEGMLRVQTAGTIVAISIHTTGEQEGEWDTIPGNGRWLVAVTDEKGNILNKADGSISLSISKPAEFRLWFEDDGSFAKGVKGGRAVLKYDDGRVLSREFEPAAPKKQPVGPGGGLKKDPREVNLGAPRQASSTDYVGKGERPGPSGKKDWVFDLQLNGKASVKQMTLEGRSPSGAMIWDTIPGNGFPLLGVGIPGKGLLNKADGTVYFDPSSQGNLMIFVEDDGFFTRKGSKQYKLKVTWSDGVVSESN